MTPCIKEYLGKKLKMLKSRQKISTGTVHTVPKDLRGNLIGSPDARETWEDITPLARNEWICWVESAKKLETRTHRIKRTIEELSEGKRRPCCWAGCPHR
jgi:uncharacterized protein YdeI (YjbR/CyaY-like superfamily)